MEILYVLIPLGLVLVAFGLWAFFWAAGDGQFDDLDSPGWTVLSDDARPPAPDDRPGNATAASPNDVDPETKP